MKKKYLLLLTIVVISLIWFKRPINQFQEVIGISSVNVCNWYHCSDTIFSTDAYDELLALIQSQRVRQRVDFRRLLPFNPGRRRSYDNFYTQIVLTLDNQDSFSLLIDFNGQIVEEGRPSWGHAFTYNLINSRKFIEDFLSIPEMWSPEDIEYFIDNLPE